MIISFELIFVIKDLQNFNVARVACLYRHWTGTFTTQNNPFPKSVFHCLNENLINPQNHKIYFDCGDQILDALYPDIQKKAVEVMKKYGFS